MLRVLKHRHVTTLFHVWPYTSYIFEWAACLQYEAEGAGGVPNFSGIIDISDLLGVFMSRLEWPETRISVGTPLWHTVASGDSLPHRSQSIGLEIQMR